MTNTSTVNPSEVGWQFVPQYYTFVNKQPNRLHCFYTKASTFIHGTEGEDGKPCYGQQVRNAFACTKSRRAARSVHSSTSHVRVFPVHRRWSGCCTRRWSGLMAGRASCWTYLSSCATRSSDLRFCRKSMLRLLQLASKTARSLSTL